MNETEKELEILEHIYHGQETVRQRDLARIVGLSLGMTNAILKRLVLRGWISVRKINNRNIHYVVTPNGIDQITRRSYRFIKRTIKNVVYYKDAILDLLAEVKARGFTGVVLVGPSDLDFVVEHACHVHGLELIHDERREMQKGQKVFLLYSESYLPDSSDGRAGLDGTPLAGKALAGKALAGAALDGAGHTGNAAFLQSLLAEGLPRPE